MYISEVEDPSDLIKKAERERKSAAQVKAEREQEKLAKEKADAARKAANAVSLAASAGLSCLFICLFQFSNLVMRILRLSNMCDGFKFNLVCV